MPRRSLIPCLTAISLLFLHGTAAANDPPAGQTMLAQFTIVPLTLFLFALTGAAALHDRRRDAAAPTPRRWVSTLIKVGMVLVVLMLVTSPGHVAPFAIVLLLCLAAAFWYERRSATRSGRANRLRLLALASLVCLLTGIHEGMAAMVSPVLGGWAVVIAIRMLRVSRDAPPGSYARWASRAGGLLLIPMALFLAGFSWIFLGHYFMASERGVVQGLVGFHQYQQAYAKQHDGTFNPIPIERLQTQDYEPLEDASATGIRRRSDAWMLGEYGSGRSRQLSITYGPDGRSYEVRVTPTLFYPWPYRHFTTRAAFLMRKDGIIRYEDMTSPGPGATAASPPLPPARLPH